MHVAFFSTPDLSYVSGSSLSLRYTVDALARLKIHCTVLCQRAPLLHRANPYVHYEELPLPLDYQVTTDSIPTSADLAACLNQLIAAAMGLPDLDLIHATYGTFTGLAATAGGALRDVPTVISTYGRDLTLGAAADPRYDRMMRMSYGHADLVLASDDAVAALVADGYCGPRTRVRVLPPGTNVAMLRVARTIPAMAGAARARGMRVLTVHSSFNPGKGLAVLLDAFAVVLRAAPGVRLTVVGHDDTPGQRIHGELTEQALRLGVTGSVEFVGHLEHEAVLRLMTESDLYVDPRSIASASSCVYEAMMLGLPVVASAVPGNAAVIDDGTSGFLVPAGDPGPLADRIVELMGDPALCDRLAASAVASAETASASVDCDGVALGLAREYAGLVAQHADRFARAGR